MDCVRVFAPASASNLGPGFDVLGVALPQPGDIVEAEWSEIPGIQIAEVTGDDGLLSVDPAVNVAGVAAASVFAALAPGSGASTAARGRVQAPGIRLRVHKQMPLCSGLGSSAASSVAGAVAINELCGRPLSKRDLLVHALAGERAAAGSTHADNAAPSLLGGIVLIRGYDPLEVLDLPVPSALRIVVVHPRLRIETSKARAMLRGYGFPIQQVVANLGNLGAFVAALYRDDLELLGRCIEDRMVEPLRIPLIPGFREVKEAARRAGALGCSISGSGPSIFALAAADDTAARVADAMESALREATGLSSDAYVGRVNREGAALVA
jgi:homoserine kinase